jgi:hypothetical protein
LLNPYVPIHRQSTVQQNARSCVLLPQSRTTLWLIKRGGSLTLLLEKMLDTTYMYLGTNVHKLMMWKYSYRIKNGSFGDIKLNLNWLKAYPNI